MTHGMPPTLLILSGPTASGKTAVSIDLATHWRTEIISCDSRQMYREMSIGTAKPSPGQLAAVPHHLIDNLSIREDYSAFRFEQDSINLLDMLFTRHEIMIMTGGTGLYMDAIINGIDDIPDPDPEIRERLKERYREEGLENILMELASLDPLYFSNVDRKNPARVLRGLEVCLSTGRPFSGFHLKKSVERPFRILLATLELPREILYARIDNRVDGMIASGLAGEAGSLYPSRNLNALKAVGYPEFFGQFDGYYGIGETIRLIKRNTRHFAKRQITWNNRYNEMKRFDPAKPEEIIRWVELNR
jgi:tRNA dimethylallyltransferase